VGSDADRPVDVRIVAATHQDLEAKIREGTFRGDLYYRLDVVPLLVPPLRERIEDIPALVQVFAGRERERSALRGFSADAMAALLRYRWPGNVRELENLVRRISILAAGEVATVDDLSALAPHVVSPTGGRGAGFREMVPLRQVEDEYIAWVLHQCAGNKTRAAEVLGIDVSTLHRRERAQSRVESA
jgi:two-component system response regulator HydG